MPSHPLGGWTPAPPRVDAATGAASDRATEGLRLCDLQDGVPLLLALSKGTLGPLEPIHSPLTMGVNRLPASMVTQPTMSSNECMMMQPHVTMGSVPPVLGKRLRTDVHAAVVAARFPMPPRSFEPVVMAKPAPATAAYDASTHHETAASVAAPNVAVPPAAAALAVAAAPASSVYFKQHASSDDNVDLSSASVPTPASTHTPTPIPTPAPTHFSTAAGCEGVHSIHSMAAVGGMSMGSQLALGSVPPPTMSQPPASRPSGAPASRSLSRSHGGRPGVFQLAMSHAQLATQIGKLLNDAADETDPAIVAYHGALRNALGLLSDASFALVKASQVPKGPLPQVTEPPAPSGSRTTDHPA